MICWFYSIFLLMNKSINFISLLSFVSIFIFSCSKPVPNPENLYKRLGGERTMVAISLQVCRKTEIMKKFTPGEKRIFRQRLAEWLCHASSGPCQFPTHKEFYDEIRINPEEEQQLLESLRQVLVETGIPERERDELLMRLSHPSN